MIYCDNNIPLYFVKSTELFMGFFGLKIKLLLLLLSRIAASMLSAILQALSNIKLSSASILF